ncbi:hypothetical protein [[Pseudopropionibacterium] massiliense]|uniref:hypothetical protein n=1 Tax=[Pseudopropionibacterium] massiliense TaxID=2220000 RepID=UPI0010307348|nr:hypothetical protein [[Pseudopropionibacterium] massiliense]
MNSFFPQQHRISRRSFGVMGLSAAASLGLPGALARAGTTDSTGTGDPSRLVLPPEGGLRLDSADFARLYGPGVFTMSTLYNVPIGTIGTVDRISSLRFRAVIAGSLQKIRLYWPAGPGGYSAGTGGRIRITVLPDDGSDQHLPALDGSPLARTHFVPGLAPGAQASLLDELTFEESPAPLVAGELYHVVLENIDPLPGANYISNNNVLVPSTVGRPARWLNNTDWATLIGDRPQGAGAERTWLDLTSAGTKDRLAAPIMQLTTTDGASQGSSDMESGSVDPDRTYETDASRPIRERFTPSVDKHVTGVSVAAVATVAGSLRWRILEGSRELASGTIQDEVRFAPYTMGYKTVDGKKAPVNVTNFVWYDVSTPQDVVLRAGGTYDLELRPEGGSRWKFAAHRNGSGRGFTWPAAFTESRAQHLHGNQWLDTNFWNYSASGGDNNWPVVLHLAP